MATATRVSFTSPMQMPRMRTGKFCPLAVGVPWEMPTAPSIRMTSPIACEAVESHEMVSR